MGILDYIERIKRENEGPRITAQEPRIGLKPGGIVEPGVTHYATESKYDIKQLNEATKFYTKEKIKTWDELNKISAKSTQSDLRQAPKYVRDAHHKKIQILQNLRSGDGKLVLPDPKGGQFKPLYFTEYSDKAFLKDLKANKGTYEIATDYYLKNKKFIQKQMVGNVEYTRPISYLAKVLSQRRKRNSEISKELTRYRNWVKEQQGPKTQIEYVRRVEKLLPLAIENGIVPPNIDTHSKYFKWAKKQKIDPLLKLFNHMEKIGVEHIAGISRAVDIMDYKSLGEIVPLLGDKSVNFEKGILYDRPMTGLAKNILKSDNATIQKKNLRALNNMSIEAAEMYNTIAVKYRLSPTDKNPIGGQMLERITKGDPLSDTLLRDADLLMKQYVASGGEKRASFKHLDPEVKKTIQLYETGDIKAGKKNLKSLVEKIGCPDFAAGGGVGFADGKDCFDKGLKNIENKNFKTKSQADNMLKLAETGSKSARLRALLGVWGLGGEVIIEAGIGAYKVLGKGVPAKIAWAESYWSYLDPRKYTGELSDLRKKDLEKSNPRIAKYFDALGVLEKRNTLKRRVEADDPQNPYIEMQQKQLNQYDEIIRNFYGGPKGITKMMEKIQPEVDEAEAIQAGRWKQEREEKYGWMFSDRQREIEADRKQKQAMKELMASHGVKTKPYTKDGKPVYEIDKELIDTDLKMFGDIMGYGWTPYGHGFGMSDGKYNEDLGYKELVDTMMWNKGMENIAQAGGVSKRATGGLANLTRTVAPDSGPMQGLASTPEYDTYRKEYKWQT